MAKYRAQITKGREIRYVSHLDYVAIFERALRRAHLPVAYSEGFHPHMKLAFTPALPVGVTSEAECMDFELTVDLPTEEILTRLTKELPAGAQVIKLRILQHKVASLSAAATSAGYVVTFPHTSISEAERTRVLHVYREAKTIPFVRVRPKYKKEFDAKTYWQDFDMQTQGDALALFLHINVTPEGSMKPSEVLTILKERFALPINLEEARIHRQELTGDDGALIDCL